MNTTTATTACQCTRCPGATCRCGCQNVQATPSAGTAAAACACGPQCGCTAAGQACACGPRQG